MSSADGAGCDEPPGLEHISAGGERERAPRVLLDEQDRDAVLVDAPNHPEDLAREDRRQPERGLVEEQQPRPRHQRAADREHLLLAAREGAGDLRLPIAEHGEEAKKPTPAARRSATAPRCARRRAGFREPRTL